MSKGLVRFKALWKAALLLRLIDSRPTRPAGVIAARDTLIGLTAPVIPILHVTAFVGQGQFESYLEIGHVCLLAGQRLQRNPCWTGRDELGGERRSDPHDSAGQRSSTPRLTESTGGALFLPVRRASFRGPF